MLGMGHFDLFLVLVGVYNMILIYPYLGRCISEILKFMTAFDRI